MATFGLLPNPGPSVAKPTEHPLRSFVLPVLLALATLVSTCAVGMRYMFHYRLGQGPLMGEDDLLPYRWMWAHRMDLASGLPFALTLIGILLAHEFGHYFACRYYGVRCTLPYLLPAPSLSGTFGAVIRLKSRIRTRTALLTVGAAGPLAGFVVALVGIAVGLAVSRVPDSSAVSMVHEIEVPLIVQAIRVAMGWAGISVAGMAAHPILSASWIGMLITALNLIPAGQLDGGHIVYALSPRAHRICSNCVIVVLTLLGIFAWVGWLLWSVVLLTPGMTHPKVESSERFSKVHLALFPVCLAMLVLCGTPRPFAGYSLIELVRVVKW